MDHTHRQEVFNIISLNKDRLQKNLVALEMRIARAAQQAGRKRNDIELVAVTKTVLTEVAGDLYELGIRTMGENRPQELKKKSAELPKVNWHFIGRLQRNKVKDVVGKVALIHSLDRWPLAEVINKRAAEQGIVQKVLLQVNVSGEESKTGITVRQIDDFLQAAADLKHINISGFMTMAPLEADTFEIRRIFAQLNHEFMRCREQYGQLADIKYLSMGMSNDFELAIAEGANMIRVGSLLFV